MPITTWLLTLGMGKSNIAFSIPRVNNHIDMDPSAIIPINVNSFKVLNKFIWPLYLLICVQMHTKPISELSLQTLYIGTKMFSPGFYAKYIKLALRCSANCAGLECFRIDLLTCSGPYFKKLNIKC